MDLNKQETSRQRGKSQDDLLQEAVRLSVAYTSPINMASDNQDRRRVHAHPNEIVDVTTRRGESKSSIASLSSIFAKEKLCTRPPLGYSDPKYNRVSSISDYY